MTDVSKHHSMGLPPRCGVCMHPWPCPDAPSIADAEREREIEVTFKITTFGRDRQVAGSMLSMQNALAVQGWTTTDFEFHEVTE